MICGFCHQEFRPEEAEKTCQACPLRGCGLLRCPRCGYEMPREPGWVQWLNRRKRHRVVKS